MTHRQDGVERSCEICGQKINPGEQMMDLFRSESVVEGSGQRVLWVHEACVRISVETWLRKKWAREAATRGE